MFGSGKLIVNREGHWRLTAMRRISRALAASLFPPRCCLCGFEGESLDLDLCGLCRADLPWNGDRAAAGLSAFRFEHPIDDLIRRLKYHGVLANARVLGVLLAQAVHKHAAPLPRLLVPVPLHISRLRERGFNQAAALARYASRMIGIPVAHHVVRRIRDTPSQTALDMGERRRNVHEAFAIDGSRALRRLQEARHVAVVDDVVTTGSTVKELRGTLLAAGVGQVDVWAVAQAPMRARDAEDQASPAFFKASSGGPSNLSSDTLPT
jgi:ComF family protein